MCDGHGQHGREVSGLLKHRLPFIIENQLKVYLKDQDLVTTYPDTEVIYQCLKESFAMAQKEVCTALPDVRFR